MMKFPAVLSLVILVNIVGFTIVSAGTEQQGIHDHTSLRARQNKESFCPDGFGGISCKENVDECKRLPYPCAGGTKLGSFCVDHDPPQKFKCGCQQGYDEVLPELTEVKDPVPVAWRPLKCLPKDVCVDFVCHEDATCMVSSSNTAVCICNDDLIGDGMANCSASAKIDPTKPPASKQQSRVCTFDSDCIKQNNSVCSDGVCKCKAGFYKSNGGGHCINENECADGYPNYCHKHAICTDTKGSYTCACRDGYQDLNPRDLPGTTCSQINECLNPAMNVCDADTQVCVDLPPPSKWECVERTPAPTPAPIPIPITTSACPYPGYC